jgi:hypothetical protein
VALSEAPSLETAYRQKPKFRVDVAVFLKLAYASVTYHALVLLPSIADGGG